MRMHARDRRKWFAANFSRTYFKSQPLVNPLGMIGFAFPCVAALLVCATLFLMYSPDSGAVVLASSPIIGAVARIDQLRQNRTDWTRQASEMLNTIEAAGGFTEETRKAYGELKEKLKKNNELLAELESLPRANPEDQVRLERERVLGIENLCKFAKVDANVLAELKTEALSKGWTPEQFGTAILRKQAEADEAEHPTDTHHVTLVRDERDTRIECMTAALDNMLDKKANKVDRNNPFAGLSIFRFAEESVRQQHKLNRIPSRMQVVELAMQNTADFADVLENSARKQLIRQYELVNPTYRIWTKASTTPDFKTMSRSRLSEAPTLIVVPEGGQITIAQMSDTKETYALATFGRGVSFTRQMLINDDLGAFNNLISQFGGQSARVENKTVYAILTTNANMSDGAALFVAGHGNLGTGTIGNTGLDAMFSAMGIQKGLDGVTILNVIPKFHLVPKAKEATARSAQMPTGPNLAAASQNWFAGRLEVVADGELDASSTAEWYGAADPNIVAGIEYAHLEGAEGPQFVRKENEQGILGIQFYCFLDFAAKAVDWTGLYKSSGA